MKIYTSLIFGIALLSLTASAGPKDGEAPTTVVAGEVVALSRSTIVPKDDPIATGQPARKAALENLGKRVRAMEKTNKGCPNEILNPKGNQK